MAVVVAQSVENSIPTVEIRRLNPVIGKFYLLSTVTNQYWRDKKKEKEAWNDQSEKLLYSVIMYSALVEQIKSCDLEHPIRVSLF